MWFNCAKKSNIYQGKKINRKADGEKIQRRLLVYYTLAHTRIINKHNIRDDLKQCANNQFIYGTVKL